MDVEGYSGRKIKFFSGRPKMSHLFGKKVTSGPDIPKRDVPRRRSSGAETGSGPRTAFIHNQRRVFTPEGDDTRRVTHGLTLSRSTEPHSASLKTSSTGNGTDGRKRGLLAVLVGDLE